MTKQRSQLQKVAGIATLMNVSEATIYKKIKEDGLPHFRIGTDIRLDVDQVLAHFQRHACDGQ